MWGDGGTSGEMVEGPKETIEYENTLEITAWLTRYVLKSFKEKILTSITRNALLNAHNNILRFYADFFYGMVSHWLLS